MPRYDYFGSHPYGAHVKVVNFVGANKRVLDVGCNTGYISKRLKEKGCFVVGIEIDPVAAELTKDYCDDLIIGDVETLDLSTLEKYDDFDVILFVDILEHLKEPLGVPKKLRRYLKDDGYIVTSIPNIACWHIRLKLLFGRFEYQEYGILDRTHLRFFNKESARRLVDNAGFEIIRFDVTPGPIPIPFLPRKLAYYLAKLLPNLLAFQFLIVAKKREPLRANLKIEDDG